MRVMVIGATGPLGQAITRKALEEEHEVTALVRDPARMPIQHPLLRVVRGDILQIGAIDAPMIAQNAVVCCLGRKPTRRPVDVFSHGTEIVLRAMRRHNVRRIVCITGIGAGDSKGHGGFLYNWIVQPLLLRTMYEDKTRQEQLVRKSDRDWVIVRPARLTDGIERRHYGVIVRTEGLQATTISRADTASFVVDQLSGNRYLYRSVVLTY